MVLFFGVLLGKGAPFCITKVYSQSSTQSNFELFTVKQPDDVPFYNVRMLNFASDSTALSRLFVQLTFVYDELQFIKADNKKFRADYEVSISYTDTADVEVTTTKWSGTVFAENFDDTKSTNIYGSTQGTVDLPPGTYTFKIELKDMETLRTGSREGRITLRDFFANGMTVSDIIFLNSVEFLESDAIDNQHDARAEEAELYAYWEIYNILEGDSIDIEFSIVNSENQVIRAGQKRIRSVGAINKEFIEIDQETRQSNFLVKLEITHKEQIIQLEQPFKLVNQDASSLYSDIEDAIEKLIYIADKKELKLLNSLEGQEQIEAFKKFWERRDPTPESSENEYMQEYYRRIEIANQNFKRSKPGWQTQMGMVYIKLGAPDYIDKPLQDQFYDPTRRGPFVVWHYPNFRRRVVFELVAGEYRIANYQEVFDLLNDEMHL